MRELLVAALLALAAVPASAGQAGRFGAGIIAGAPVGATAKYWLDDMIAFDGGAGYDNAGVFYSDVLFNNWTIATPAKGRANLYAGAGPRVATDSGGQFSIRVIAGAGYWSDNQPLEFFIELGPTFKVTPDNKVGIDGGIGLRYYFTLGASPAR